MSIMQNAIGGAFTETSTDPTFELGTHMKGDAGSEWVYVQANGAIASAGQAVVVDETNQAALANNGVNYGDIVAVAGGAFADNEYGWVQVKGVCVIQVAANCAANTALASTSTAGQIDDAAGSGTKNMTGVVLTAARGGTAGTAAGMLNYPIVTSAN